MTPARAKGHVQATVPSGALQTASIGATEMSKGDGACLELRLHAGNLQRWFWRHRVGEPHRVEALHCRAEWELPPHLVNSKVVPNKRYHVTWQGHAQVAITQVAIHIYTNTCTQMFTLALFMMAPNCEPLKALSPTVP